MKYEEFMEEVQKRAHRGEMSVLVDALSKGEFEDIRATADRVLL